MAQAPALTRPTTRARRQLRRARGSCVGAEAHRPHADAVATRTYGKSHWTTTDAGAEVRTTGPRLVHGTPLMSGDRPTKKNVPGARSTWNWSRPDRGVN